MKGDIRVKRNIADYKHELGQRPAGDKNKFFAPLGYNGCDLRAAVEKEVISIAELLWIGPVVKEFAENGNIFSQEFTDPLPRPTSWGDGPAPEDFDMRDIVSGPFICLRDVGNQKIYKAHLSAFLYLLPLSFPIYDKHPPDYARMAGGNSMDGFASFGGPKEDMTKKEIYDFMQAGGVPYDVKIYKPEKTNKSSGG